MRWFKNGSIIYISIIFILIVAGNSCVQNEEAERNNEAYLNLTLEERRMPEHATESFQMSDGLDVKLFASEPMVVNPTNIDVDEKGRVWVCESPEYGSWEDMETSEGRISILEDTDGDGVADKRTVFYQGRDVNIALGIAVLGNKVYITRSPDMLVFTDKDGDDVPDKKEKLFTGMGPPGDHSAHAVVFGPDGKLYWNMGNTAGPVKDAEGNQVIDTAGHEVVQDGENYTGGMIFRNNPDGSEFEVLAHNFRNNYEVAVDSYGNLWQSDNDDDGNKSCRINFILEYGNYGYRDEVTRESWSTHRTNTETEIPRRHWHQNDPGVVPNLLITGAGSPAGISVYEGSLLPEEFHGEMLHTDAGPNVARAYPVSKDGAGFEAGILNMLESQYDQWFRPVDITTAPDGSVFIADWYDPGVGGAVAADDEKGRIFRVAPNSDRYNVSTVDLSTGQGAIEALKSPNSSARYLGWTNLHEQGADAEEVLLDLFESDNPLYRARALWLLGKIPGREEEYINRAIRDENPDIRIIGVRLARQSDLDFTEIAAKLTDDPAPEVRREVAIGLHLISTPEAADVWSELALHYTGEDRWYLEALGIGAANNWEMAFQNWLEKVGDNWNTEAGKDIVWRARSRTAIPLLAKLIRNADSENERARYFRAFDFHVDDSKQHVLLSLLSENNDQITTLALQHINPEKVGMPNLLRDALDRILSSVEGTQAFVELVKRYNITTKRDELIKLAIDQSGNETGVGAARLLLDQDSLNTGEIIASKIRDDEETGQALVGSIGRVGNQNSLDLLSDVVLDSSIALGVRRSAILALGNSWTGEEALLETVKDSMFDEKLHAAAGSVLFNVYRTEIQQEAEKYISRPSTAAGESLPTIRNLVPATGQVEKGREVFETYCLTCHAVNGEGTKFGPDLSEIGDKLSKEGLYRAIIYPSEGISHGYEGHLLHLNDGSIVLGIIQSETDEFVEMRLMGGITNRYQTSEIESMEEYPESLMTNLSGSMNAEQLINLVEYLSGLQE